MQQKYLKGHEDIKVVQRKQKIYNNLQCNIYNIDEVIKMDRLKEIDFSDDDQLIDLILDTECGLYEGTNSDGEEITISVQKNVGIRVRTYQNNGWIRINDYDLDEDEFRQYYIERSESYEKQSLSDMWKYLQ